MFIQEISIASDNYQKVHFATGIIKCFVLVINIYNVGLWYFIEIYIFKTPNSHC